MHASAKFSIKLRMRLAIFEEKRETTNKKQCVDGTFFGQCYLMTCVWGQRPNNTLPLCARYGCLDIVK